MRQKYSQTTVLCFFELNTSIKAPPKTHRFVYDYWRGDFEGPWSVLRVTNLSNCISGEDINSDWQCWRDVFLVGVADHIPRKRLKGRNPVPWINGQIINLIKKKETTHQKLKRSPTSDYLRKKFKGMCSEVKRLIQVSRDAFFGLMESDLKCNPKRFWSVLSHKSKLRNILEAISQLQTLASLKTSGEYKLTTPRI